MAARQLNPNPSTMRTRRADRQNDNMTPNERAVQILTAILKKEDFRDHFQDGQIQYLVNVISRHAFLATYSMDQFAITFLIMMKFDKLRIDSNGIQVFPVDIKTFPQLRAFVIKTGNEEEDIYLQEKYSYEVGIISAAYDLSIIKRKRARQLKDDDPESGSVKQLNDHVWNEFLATIIRYWELFLIAMSS